jgi:hypothetical protein
MKKVFFTIIVSSILFLLISPSSVSAVNLTPLNLTPELVDFGNADYDLDLDAQIGGGSKSRIIWFRNDYSGGAEPTVRKIGITNTFRNTSGATPFRIYHPTEGYLGDRSFSYNTNIPLGGESSVMFSINLTRDVLSDCISQKKKSCVIEKWGSIYVNSYYCNIPIMDCVVDGGFSFKPRVTVNFLLPEPRVSTSKLDFGDVEVGKSVTKKVTLYNDSPNYHFSFIFPNNSGPFTSITSGSQMGLGAGLSRDYEITFTPTSTQSYSTSFVLVDRRSNVRQIADSASFQLVGRGVEKVDPTETPIPEPRNTPSEGSNNDKVEKPLSNPRFVSDGVVIEQSIVTEESDEDPEVILSSFIVQDVDSSKETYVSGIGLKDTKYLINLRGDSEISFYVTTDENGNWEYTIDEEIPDGEYEVFVAKVDDNNNAIESLYKIAGVTVESQREDSSKDSNMKEEDAGFDIMQYWWVLIPLFSFFVILLVIVKRVARKRSKESK